MDSQNEQIKEIDAKLVALEVERGLAEQALEDAKKKYEEAKTKAEADPKDDEYKKGLEARSVRLTEARDALAKLTQDFLATTARAAALAKKPALPPPRPNEIEYDDHLDKKSTLRYGGDRDVTSINPEAPSGQVAAWLTIVTYLLLFSIDTVMKALFMLTVRGRELIKECKGSRIGFRNDSETFPDNATGVTRHRRLYISMATASTSISESELTPGRFRTAVSGMYPNEIMGHKIISPVMGVIGFQQFAENWPEKVERLGAELIAGGPKTVNIKDGNKEEAHVCNTVAEYLAAKALMTELTLPLPVYRDLRRMIGNTTTLPKFFADEAVPYCFAVAPDRCPPTMIGIVGVPELGAFFSLCQDMRNTIIASKTAGTAEEKVKKQSSFYSSYMRRTQSMGIQIDQTILLELLRFFGNDCVDNFNLGADMDSTVRTVCQTLINNKVKEISNMEPLKM